MNIKSWWLWNRPIFMNRKKLSKILMKYSEDISKLERNAAWMTIRPMITDLENFRANTWDQDKITFWQEYLKDNFKHE